MANYLDPYFAVFNNHTNNANERARKALTKMQPEWGERIEELEKEGNGIMYIFKIPPPFK